MPQKGYIGATVCKVFWNLKVGFNLHLYFERHIKRWKIVLHNMKKRNSNVKEIISPEEGEFQEEGTESFVLMSVKNSLLFNWHSIFIKSRFSVHGIYSASKPIICRVVRIKWKKMGKHPNYYDFGRKWIRGWSKEYNISLKHLNKSFSITQNEHKKRVISL